MPIDAIGYTAFALWGGGVAFVSSMYFISRRELRRDCEDENTTRRIKEQLAIYTDGLHEYLKNPKRYLDR